MAFSEICTKNGMTNIPKRRKCVPAHGQGLTFVKLMHKLIVKLGYSAPSSAFLRLPKKDYWN